MSIFEVSDDSGFLALIDPTAYEGFVDSDWTLDQLFAHFQAQMLRRSLLIWGTGMEGGWNVDVVFAAVKTEGFRQVSGPLHIVGSTLLLTNYESLTMAASSPDVTLPEKHQQDLSVSLPNGEYTCRIIQLFDPDEVDDTEDGIFDGSINFVIEILKSTSHSPPWTSIPWLDVDG